MPAGKKKAVAPPIDRPLAKAYLRQFSGWSTAYPPGQSEPSSCRIMENVMVLRNEGLAVRPGLRYTSYEETPDMDPDTNGVAGVAFDKPLVGVFEPFYLNTGEKALLFAVREDDDTVGFRALHFAQPDKTVYELTDPVIGFYIPQGVTTLNFSAATKHVTYLQIDNKVLALSDAGETPRMFTVGAMKIAKRLNTVPVPEWEDGHKPTLKQPGYAWMAKLAVHRSAQRMSQPLLRGRLLLLGQVRPLRLGVHQDHLVQQHRGLADPAVEAVTHEPRPVPAAQRVQ